MSPPGAPMDEGRVDQICSLIDAQMLVSHTHRYVQAALDRLEAWSAEIRDLLLAAGSDAEAPDADGRWVLACLSNAGTWLHLALQSPQPDRFLKQARRQLAQANASDPSCAA